MPIEIDLLMQVLTGLGPSTLTFIAGWFAANRMIPAKVGDMNEPMDGPTKLKATVLTIMAAGALTGFIGMMDGMRWLWFAYAPILLAGAMGALAHSKRQQQRHHDHP